MPAAPTILAADLPLIVPMQLKISQMKLRAIIVLIVSRSKGVTISFKTDPLESVLVSSTFDSVPSVRRHLQSEIENRLRDLLQKELPALVHTTSNDWLRRTGVNSGGGEDFREPFAPEPSFAFERPLPQRKAGSPFSLNEFQKTSPPWTHVQTPSVAAQSAPADMAPLSARTIPDSPKSRIERQSLVDSSPNEFESASVITGGNEHYFNTHNNIIMRAPTEQALPDPALLDRSKIFQKRKSNLSRMFDSLFKIPEATKSKEELDSEGKGLKVIDSIGMGFTASGVCSVRSFIDVGKAFSTVSGARFSRHFAFDRYSEADPNLVQFEPDEFRTDFSDRPVNTARPAISRTFSQSVEGSKSLATKLGIMRKLQSTLAPETFSESNVIYRTGNKER